MGTGGEPIWKGLKDENGVSGSSTFVSLIGVEISSSVDILGTLLLVFLKVDGGGLSYCGSTSVTRLRDGVLAEDFLVLLGGKSSW